MIKKLVAGTALSILIFCSTSFLTVLFQINSPLHRQTDDHLAIGFPLSYYSQFMVDCSIPNSGWDGKHLLFDILSIWALTTGVFLIVKRNR